MSEDYIKTKEYQDFLRYYQTKDKKLREELIHRYLYIAQILAKRFINKGIEYEDLCQVATIGIMYAIDRFNPERGVKFATFATPTVLGEIRKYFRDKGNFIKIPRALFEIYYKAEKLKKNHEGSELSTHELAVALDVSDDDIKKAYKTGDIAFVQSLEYEAYADGAMNLSNFLGREDDRFILIEDKEFISGVIKKLRKREQEFIKLRFYDELTQAEISKILNVSQMTVSRLEKSVINKFRKVYSHE